MRNRTDVHLVALVLVLVAAAWSVQPTVTAQQAAKRPFTIDQILSLPTPDNLIASRVGSTIAWTFNERGVRNIYIADAPEYIARRLTAYAEDDGQELTNLSFSSDGTMVVYVRGGDHGAGRGDAPNPAASPVQPKVQVWSVPVAGSGPKLLGEGDDPIIAPDGKRVTFVRDRRIWFVPIDGSKPAEAAISLRGTPRMTRSPSL